MGRHAGGLIHDQQGCVLIDDRHVKLFSGRGLGVQPFLGAMISHYLSGSEFLSFFSRSPIDPEELVVDGGLQLATGKMGQTLTHKRVQANLAGIGRDRPGFNANALYLIPHHSYRTIFTIVLQRNH